MPHDADLLPATLPTPCLLVGDVHVGAVPDDAEDAFIALLRAMHGRVRSVVLMGDVFDFWFAWGPAIPAVGHRTLAAIRETTAAGVPVLWLGGNHDCWCGDRLAALTGATYTLAPWHGHLGPHRVSLHHGDGLRVDEDRPYRRLRTVLRHPLSARAFAALPPAFGTWLAQRSSHTSRVAGGARARDGGAGLRRIAGEWLNTPHDPALVAFGHTHVPVLERQAAGVYANAGAFFIDRQYLVVDGTTVRRCRWTGSAEDDVLDALEFVAEEAPAEREKAVRRVGGDEPVSA